jgi:hypothetical protein
MTARGAGILGSVTFVLLLAFGSYLLDVPTPTVIVATVFAIVVILWVGTSARAGNARSFSADRSHTSPANDSTPRGPEGDS